MVGTTAWNLCVADPVRARLLAEHCGVEPLIGQLLLNRGIDHPDDAQRFLTPRLEVLDDPLSLPDMAEAVRRLRRAVSARESILVFSDSDVDGLTAAAIVVEALKAWGARVRVQLSNRIDDGYGFPSAMVEPVVRGGATLLILLDCGTNQAAEIQALARRGVDTIILDHHLPMDHPAAPAALVNPYCGSGAGRGFCSAGLAFKLAQALWDGEVEPLSAWLDVAALGTLADYAPLHGDNRVLVTAGLERLSPSARPGLAQLCEAVGMTTPTTEQVLRKLVPPLNAAGRLGDARPAWELLVTRSRPAAARLVGVVTALHDKTKLLHREIIAQANAQASRIHFKDNDVMVLGGRGWHPGLMGPLAAQLAERYGRPAIAIAVDERGVGVGSGRSPSAFDLLDALRACDGMLLRYGGHQRACGLTLRVDDLDAFRRTINQHAQASGARQRLSRALQIDAEVSVRDVTTAVASSMERLAPFGPGNPRAAVLMRRVSVRQEATGGSWVTDGTSAVRLRGRLTGVVPSERYDVVGSPGIQEGKLVVAMRDVRMAASGPS